MARKYTNLTLHEATILDMKSQGKTRQEIADALGLEKLQIKEFIKRYNRKARMAEAGHIQRRKGRSRIRPATTAEEMALKIRELEREVEILRSFLHVAGRM